MTKISNQYSLTNILTADLANSRLGINNVSPAYSLDLTGTARTSGATYLATASGNVAIGTTSAGTIASTNPTELTIQKFANGANATTTISNAYYLGVGGGEYTFNSYRLIGFGYTDTASTQYPAYIGYQETNTGGYSNGSLIFGTRNTTVATDAPTERMRITADGNVGIGNTSPGLNLSVQGLYGMPTTSGAQTGGILRVQDSSSNISLDMGVIQYFGSWIQSINKANSSVLTLALNPNGGSIGIGTTTIASDYKLAVYGTNSLMTFQNVNTGQTNGDGFAVGSFGNVDAYLYNYENANMIFGTNATERMRLTSGGNLLVGTTTNQGEKVYVNGGVRATGGMYASLFEGEFGIVCASTPYAGAFISYNLAQLDPGIYLINAYMMRGGDGVNLTYSVMWYYMHLSGFGGGSDAIVALYNNPGPQNNNGGISLSGYTVGIGWGGARGPAAVTATKLRDAY